MHKSIATINAPQFINLQPLDISPLMSSCEIKVLYIGENRNHSYITKEVAMEMSKTLRGAPIVGYYRQDVEDFGDHGSQVIIDGDGIKFNCLTKPYGFVSPDAKVWFQTFEDTDSFGNKVEREYLMTTGYLWTGQFEECKLATTEGRPHSMELDEASLKGHWETDRASGMEFFIINDATFSKLCILGEDVEPCFEGSSVTAPKVSSNFTQMDDEFKKTLFSMMQELKFALQGGQQMEDKVITSDPVVEEPAAAAVECTEEIPAAESEAPVVETVEAPTADVESDFAASQEENESSSTEEQEEGSLEENTQEFAKKEEEEEEKEESSEENSDTPIEEGKKCDEEDEDKEKKYELLQADYQALQEQYSALQAEFAALEVKCNELVEFKATIEDAKKDEMINKFYFLSDEDKKEVVENKSKYTIDEIESKLSVICVRNKVNFNLDDNSKNDIKTEDPVITTFTISDEGPSIPAWIAAVKNNQKK